MVTTAVRLEDRKCKPCKGDVPPLKGGDLRAYYQQLGNNWKVIDEHHLEKEFRFKDFRAALEFTNKVGELAEQEGHHPEIGLGWGRVQITLSTHKIDGLSENDFILAAKIEKLPHEQR